MNIIYMYYILYNKNYPKPNKIIYGLILFTNNIELFTYI